ncbi:class I SAM-dependent methyltransferase [Galactobacter caseinivorans]|uniref:Class I SAM-dependent methyltransferase n=1 Tax=Galactobacter caseinivorans TaxID=2676123 RepID=A0A496PHP2_9MICC|nr:class I SAM-dependent methyltransferase [Galactobacter caseinivorans]RKW70001.1 class I SAM-dependent methyltransferase [Galactobacter caseinivorans]
MTEEFRYENVSHADAFAANLANWEDRVPIHLEQYGLEAFDDPQHRSTVVTQDVPVLERFAGPLRGQSLVHLQCHIGSDTVSLARSGARVTGVDFSASALEAARGLAHRTGADATFVESNVYGAAEAVKAAGVGPADVVYTSIGTIGWLPDLFAWAREIFALLRPGGTFMIRDGHPFALVFDPDAPEPLTPRFHYFAGSQAERWQDSTTYVGDGSQVVEHATTYSWPHPVSEILQAILAAGLKLEHFDEGKELPWELIPTMSKLPNGDYVLPQAYAQSVPLTFTLVAHRPA